ncbi:MAG: WYL domain-containing protein [Methylobacter sp.]
MTERDRTWSAESRLQFIEFRLYWEGRINRGDLVKHFGISVPQASLDLKRYVEIAPDNLQYDKQRKAYFATSSFEPKIISPSSKDYLAQLDMLETEKGLSFSHQPFVSNPPKFDVVPLVSRVVKPEILQGVIKAIRESKAIHICYQSMNRPEPTYRWITPHAIVSDGSRWHVRAYCHDIDNGEFRDFVFGRILDLKDTKESDANPANDIAWNTMVELTIAPNQGLSDAQKRMIESDYGMENGITKIVVRKALSGYLKLRLGFTNDITNKNSGVASAPEKQQICLINEIELAFNT